MPGILDIAAAEAVKTVVATLMGAAIAGSGQLLGIVRRKLGRLPPDREELEKLILQEAERDPQFRQELFDALAALDAGPVPAVSPAPPDPFVNRDRARAEVAAVTGVWVIAGSDRAGKTALVTRVARDVAARFPAGQIVVDLDGFRDGQTLRVAEVQQHVLGLLGVPEVESSAPLVQQQYLSALVRRRFVLVLENALGEAEVQPLAQPWPCSLVLVTTRKLTDDLRMWCPPGRLVELHGLDEPGASALLASRCGHAMLAAEPEATRRLLDLCDRMPFAILLFGSMLDRRAGEPGAVGALLAELGEALTKERVIEQSLARAVDRLSPTTVDDLLVLAFHAGEDFTRHSADAMLGHSARRAVDELIDACLLERERGRLRLHRLVREYANRLARRRGVELDPYLDRLLSAYRDWTIEADHAIDRDRLRCYPRPATVAPWSLPVPPLAWLDAESGVLVELVRQASQRGRHEIAVQLTGGVEQLLNNRGQHWRCAEAFDWAIRSAEALGDPALRARLHALQGRVFTLLHAFDRAAAHIDAAKRLMAGVHHPRLESSILEFEARLIEECAEHLPPGDRPAALRPAIALLRRAVEIDRREGLARGLGLHRRMLANALVKVGEPEQARAILVHAAETGERPRRPGDARNQARVHMVLARAYTALGERTRARDALADARDLIGQSGATQYGLEFADIEAELALRAGDVEAARSRWGWVADQYCRWGHPRFNVYFDKLSRLPPPRR